MTEISTNPVHIQPGLNNLLSRYAECMMWLARYMERIENLARLLEVTESFVRGADGRPGWDTILQINSDEDCFFARHQTATEQEVLAFYVTEQENPNSIKAMAHAVRENARAVRPLISTEMWMQLNVFTRWVLDLHPSDIRANSLSGLCNRLKQECQSHYGITEGTLYRDQAWLFYLLGKHLERSDQITRLIDIRYHTLLPAHEEVGSGIDITQWASILRSAAAYHAFRRLQPVTTTPVNVVGFLLKNEGFPRSLSTSLRMLDSTLSTIAGHGSLRRLCAPIQECVAELRVTLADQTVEDIIIRGLHEYMQWIQTQISRVQQETALAFWPAPGILGGTPSVQVQQ
ncbi:alpha-E domain-containing protein [Acetobacter farinalis]|uniref:Alpha-E domain-containing protein n=1 Tax=Acetobacter farinalis TaxID=1260984 RepID=A0ABT3Q8D1_9PROT|nr:alpha-E domain-containing protein [Acetobacter farinalis]MCX2561535.1 alpha-E domain-containing protein [Acetobacter farinalis]